MAQSRVDRARQAVRALTAASSPLIPSDTRTVQLFSTPEEIRPAHKQWQAEVLELAESSSGVPEVAGAGSLVRGSIDRIAFTAEADPKSPAPAQPPTIADSQRRIDALDFGRMAELIFYTGETWITWKTLIETEVDLPQALAVTEVDTKSNPKRVADGVGSMKDLPADVQLMRIFKPALKNRYDAHSPHRAAIPVMRAMRLHQVADTAVAMSRIMSAGLLVWPTERKSMGVNPDTGLPFPGSQEELVQAFRAIASQTIQNLDSTDVAATIPFIFTVDNQLDAKNAVPQLVHLERDDHAVSYKTRYDMYRLRYASAIDLPIEQTTGMGATNHWSAWSIREDMWKSYLAPIVKLILDALNKRIGAPNGIKFTADAKELISKPDQTSIILQLLKLQNVTPQSAQKALLSGDLKDLVMQDAPAGAYISTSSPGSSDFTTGGSRGGGAFPGG